MIELIDVVCPACEKLIVCLPSGGVAGLHCSRCKIDFIAKIVGRTQLYQYGRGYRRGKSCEVVLQEEPLLPKASGRYDKVEETAVTPGCPRDFRVEPILPVPGMVVDA